MNKDNIKAVFMFRLPQSLLDALDAYALSADCSREAAARRLLAAGLDYTLDETHGNTRYANAEQRRIAHNKSVQAYKRRKA